MKAIVWTKYGPPDGLQLKEVEKPSPKDNEVLIRIRATTVTAGDTEMRNLKMPFMFSFPMRIYVGLRKPKRITILGQELSGDVDAVGKEVELFDKGDQVIRTTGFGFGANAEYICLPGVAKEMKGALAIKPVNMTYEEAAAVPTAGFEALHLLRQGNIQKGTKVLVFGAGGSIGTFSVQFAKYLGAEVTGLDSTGKLDMLRSIGADHVIDYTQEDFTENAVTYDVILDVIGKSPYSRSLKSLKPNGRYLLANPGLSQMVRRPWTSMRTGKQVIFGSSSQKAEDLIFLSGLIEEGRIRSVIDSTSPLEQIPEAHRYAEQGDKKGNIAITVEHSSKT